ncbi:hypothetical protein F4780DRAFT_64348 [Xylariomycetidae sp. FL0641]|nr:hypothetical protein F4780DRAFT_64348 [Xylariomycetidae sp. FL0641]
MFYNALASRIQQERPRAEVVEQIWSRLHSLVSPLSGIVSLTQNTETPDAAVDRLWQYLQEQRPPPGHADQENTVVDLGEAQSEHGEVSSFESPVEPSYGSPLASATEGESETSRTHAVNPDEAESDAADSEHNQSADSPSGSHVSASNSAAVTLDGLTDQEAVPNHYAHTAASESDESSVVSTQPARRRARNGTSESDDSEYLPSTDRESD